MLYTMHIKEKKNTVKTTSRYEKQLKESMWQSIITGSMQCLPDHITQRKMPPSMASCQTADVPRPDKFAVGEGPKISFWSKVPRQEACKFNVSTASIWHTVHVLYSGGASTDCPDLHCMCRSIRKHMPVVLMDFNYVGLVLRRRQSYPVCG